MELTWIAIIASLFMGVGALLVFIFAVKQDYFRNLEDAKYQVFWSDLEELVESAMAQPDADSLEDHTDDHGQQSQDRTT